MDTQSCSFSKITYFYIDQSQNEERLTTVQ
ncbi:hypothetical protein AVENLUH8758_03205 [Acinetobacter venetianus]|nr:hypothetical protein AVENLUH8758_03205 [Acinetobacter venetianus]